MAGSGSAFNTLANAILILKVNGIHTVCKPLEPDVYDVPHCLHEAYTTPHIATCSISTKFKISSIRKYCIKHIGIN